MKNRNHFGRKEEIIGKLSKLKNSKIKLNPEREKWFKYGVGRDYLKKKIKDY